MSALFSIVIQSRRSAAKDLANYFVHTLGAISLGGREVPRRLRDSG